MSFIFIKRIKKELQLYKKDNFTFPNLILQPSNDLSVWYFIIYNLDDTDYAGGMYLGKVLLPPGYPFKAPDFMFLTETGRFEINKKICTSFSGFHNDLYSPSWNIASMCAGLVSFLTDCQDTIESKGIGGIYSSKEDKKKIAMDSIEIIKKNDIVKTYFTNFI